MSKYPTLPAGYALGGSNKVKRARLFPHNPNMKKPSLRQRIGQWLLKDSDNDSQYNTASVEVETLSSNGMRFNLYKASGGFVIETRLYDDHNDRNINKLHIITEDQDLGDALGKIITMESLR